MMLSALLPIGRSGRKRHLLILTRRKRSRARPQSSQPIHLGTAQGSQELPVAPQVPREAATPDVGGACPQRFDMRPESGYVSNTAENRPERVCLPARRTVENRLSTNCSLGALHIGDKVVAKDWYLVNRRRF